jgi:hypothetical protein
MISNFAKFIELKNNIKKGTIKIGNKIVGLFIFASPSYIIWAKP